MASYDKGPPPDLTHRFKLKAKYASLQQKYFRALKVRKDLTIEASEKTNTEQRLQDEIDLIIDQIDHNDYTSLKPEDYHFFSEEEEEEDADGEDDEEGAVGGPAVGGVKTNGDMSKVGSTKPIGTNGSGKWEGVNGKHESTNGHVDAPDSSVASGNSRVRKERSYDSPENELLANSTEPAVKRLRVEEGSPSSVPVVTSNGVGP
ncbi:hypothetical protein T439DRAFT_320278 [Meredithblackwellia eburnea MCA 4105]